MRQVDGKRPKQPTLILFSGLPGCGKTTLARRVAQYFQLPLFSKDRFQSALRRQGLAGRSTVDGYRLILDQADEQLNLGLGSVLDAVFPLPGFRAEASQIARRHEAELRVIVCHCSDETVWERRLLARKQYVPDWTPVGWSEVERLRAEFQPWDAQLTHLAVDALNDLEDNFLQVKHFIHGSLVGSGL